MKKINLYKIISFSYKSRIFLVYVLAPLSLKSDSVPVYIYIYIYIFIYEKNNFLLSKVNKKPKLPK